MTATGSNSQFGWIRRVWEKPFARNLLFGLIYLIATRIGLGFIVPPEGIAMIWPASGVALAILLLRPKREWGMLLVMFFVINAVLNLLSHNSFPVSAGYALANTVEPALFGWTLSRLRREPVTFTRLGDVLALAFVASFVNAITASLGALVPVLGFGAQYADVWSIWWIADGLSILAVTPFILLWTRGGSLLDRQPVGRRIENILWLIVLCASAWYMFGVSGMNVRLEPRPYMLFPVLIWAALRFDPRASATGLVLLSVIALGYTGAGLGIFPLGGDTPLNRLLAVQAYFCIASITTMLLTVSFTERKQAEAAIRQSEKQFRSMVENGADAITLVGADGNVVYEGPTVERITSYSAKERIGRSGLETIHPDDLPAIRKTFASVGANPGMAQSTEFRAVRKDGRVWWVEGTATNLLHDPSVQAIVVNYRDVTARKQAEAERERLLGELERKNKELETLVYIASHDLRSPLVNIQGFGKNLQKYFGQISDILESASSLDEYRSSARTILAERIPAALRFIATGSTKMESLIDGLLRLSRIGRLSFNLEMLNMTTLVQGILDAMAFQIEKAGATVNIVQPLADCYADRNQLSQLFSNLLDNALKYRAANRPLAITISGQTGPGKVIYTVADTGVGIEPEDQNKIWEIFRRIEDREGIPGEGLGLTIAQRIVERHRGRIWVESGPGSGSCFYVELPAKSEFHAASAGGKYDQGLRSQ